MGGAYMEKDEFTISPIGYVRAGDDGFRLEIEPKYVPALQELEGFSHINVLWWCHLLDDEMYREIVEVDQPYLQAPPKMGLLATRSPARPNPIALTVAPLLGIDFDQGVIHVSYIDAEDGTPILDLKPYHPSSDRVKSVSVPEWCSHWPEWYEDSAEFDWESEFVFAQ